MTLQEFSRQIIRSVDFRVVSANFRHLTIIERGYTSFDLRSFICPVENVFGRSSSARVSGVKRQDV